MLDILLINFMESFGFSVIPLNEIFYNDHALPPVASSNETQPF